MKEIQPEKPVGKSLAEMTHHHPQLGELIENATQDNPQQMQAGLDGKAVDRAFKSPFGKRRVHVARWRARMQIDRYIKRLRRRENIPEFRIVEIFAVRVRIDDRALQAKLADCALEFLRRSARILRRNRGEPGVAVRMLPNRFGQLIVRGNRERRRSMPVENLHAGIRQRKDLPGNTSRVHIAQPLFAKVGDARSDALRARARPQKISPLADEPRIEIVALPEERSPSLEQFRRGKCFFRRDPQIAGLRVLRHSLFSVHTLDYFPQIRALNLRQCFFGIESLAMSPELPPSRLLSLLQQGDFSHPGIDFVPDQLASLTEPRSKHGEAEVAVAGDILYVLKKADRDKALEFGVRIVKKAFDRGK